MAYQYELVLFDLDGTLTDSGLGIMNSVQYALKKIGRGVENLEELKAGGFYDKCDGYLKNGG